MRGKQAHTGGEKARKRETGGRLREDARDTMRVCLSGKCCPTWLALPAKHSVQTEPGHNGPRRGGQLTSRPEQASSGQETDVLCGSIVSEQKEFESDHISSDLLQQ